MSTSDQGPDQGTIDAVLTALKKLDNEEITKYVAALEKMVQDGGRRGMPRATCDDYCKTNQGLIGIGG
ncbi:hypothetical protein J4E90_005037 [Alternaria incomplexa]|uniref:uncharacterized protein n=1 Tax=Alternaria incomplexa TaxID=1187928 RepID=UPI00221E9F2E|nr:uncharacterized protein J4E90_005037 [Alternaria incomplexa]KAI4915000.1 hypothetical protein J4E90_005037 [Alternaria incomplexa]